ncbi:MAG: chitobiase/beta-hexosaminidase C-terminal domain-containing protein [Spirochaetia bacterium]|nr:chitobiase/beta-hexosaminidase C-terminal domain-containing protein [Spirochaetia bacterium]
MYKIMQIRQSDFILNGTEVATSNDGYFDSGLLATSVAGKTLKYTILVCVKSGGVMEELVYQIMKDTMPPVVSANPPGGTYGVAQSVTISCNDGIGSGCNQIVYTKDGSMPSLNSQSAENHIVSGNNVYLNVA